MHLIYFDESGNSGANLKDTSQPIFVLGALIVPETCWQALERDLETARKARFPQMEADGTEIHGYSLRNLGPPFKEQDRAGCHGLRDDWFKVAQDHKLRFTYRAIRKPDYEKAMIEQLGFSRPPNPHLPAFALLATCINAQLVKEKALGVFISDHCRGVDETVERAIRDLRLKPGALQLTNVVEKGFFIDSRKSRILQLRDVCSLYARKKEELRINFRSRNATKAASDSEGALSRGST